MKYTFKKERKKYCTKIKGLEKKRTADRKLRQICILKGANERKSYNKYLYDK